MSSPAFPKLEQPVALTADEVSIVRPTIDPEEGRQAVVRKVHEGLLRPFDIANARLDEPKLLFLPFWRINATFEGVLDLARRALDQASARAAIDSAETVVVICARRAFMYDPRLRSKLARGTFEYPLGVSLAQMTRYDASRDELARGEIVEPDLDRAQAEGIATAMLFREWRFANLLSSAWEPRVLDAKFFLFPVYNAAYTYTGEARREPREELFVALSGTTGEVVAATYPSATRSVAAKVRRWLSFDRRS